MAVVCEFKKSLIWFSNSKTLNIAVPALPLQSMIETSSFLQDNSFNQTDHPSKKKEDKNVTRTDQSSEKEKPTAVTAVLPFHLLFTSRFDIGVLYSIRIKANDLTPIAYDSVVCARGLSQKMPRSLTSLRHVERLNMILQIPELGAVAIANQAGRVMLLTMTNSAEYRCGFRVDWILPLRTQEEKELRPEVALMGMAVGPIQGREAMDKYSRFDLPDQHSEERWNPLGYPRRYRLFLIYCDHTVLSYEVTRSPAGNDLGAQDRIILL